MINIQIYNANKYPIKKKKILDIIEKFIRVKKINRRDNFELSIAFVANPEIKKINRKYRGINKATDVLSFGALARGKNKYEELAEIIISYDQAEKQARFFKILTETEIKKLLIHGLLHLKGFDHKVKKEAIVMEKLEKILMGIENASPNPS